MDQIRLSLTLCWQLKLFILWSCQNVEQTAPLSLCRRDSKIYIWNIQFRVRMKELPLDNFWPHIVISDVHHSQSGRVQTWSQLILTRGKLKDSVLRGFPTRIRTHPLYMLEDPCRLSTSNNQSIYFTSITPFGLISSTPICCCCSSLDLTTKDGAQLDDILAPKGSLPSESFNCSFASLPETSRSLVTQAHWLSLVVCL